MKTGMFGKTLTVLSGIVIPVAVWTHYQLELGNPLHRAHDIHGLNAWLNLLCLGVCVVVFGAMCYSIWEHRKSGGPKAPHFYESMAVELVWAAIPFAILMVAAYPATKTVLEQNTADSRHMTEERVASR